MSFAELKALIRFNLSKLSSQNKHHTFEDLAREFARLRICETILPATGPICAGGDQGRDFENYRSYLASTPIASSTFIGKSHDKKLVFACSLQKKIISKLKADLIAIFNTKEKINHVYYFCEEEISVAKRHELQNYASEKYQAGLDCELAS